MARDKPLDGTKCRDSRQTPLKKETVVMGLHIRKRLINGGKKNMRKYRFFINVDDIKSTIDPSVSKNKQEPVVGSPSAGVPERTGRDGNCLLASDTSPPADMAASGTVPYPREAAKSVEARVSDNIDHINISIDDFDPVEFKNRLVYVNNGLAIPQPGKWKSIDDCREKDQNATRRFWVFFRKKIFHLLMRNDPFLTHSDVDAIYNGLKQYFEIKDYEYFYEHHYKYEKW